MSERIGDWIQTMSGKQFWPLDPRAEEIDIEDIAHALSNQCRFAGHVKKFYSVAEHSVRVSKAVSPESALWGLLHDASEAYLVDLPRPIKRFSEMGRLYREHEANLMRVICTRFGLPEQEPADVAHFDTVLLMTEKRDLTEMEPKPWEDTAEPLKEFINPWLPMMARALFLEAFRKYTASGNTPGVAERSGKTCR